MNTVELDTVEKTVQFITDWHTNRLARVEHLLQVPQGVEFTIGDSEVQILEGKLHAGFLLGVSLALNEFQTLPITVSNSEEQTNELH